MKKLIFILMVLAVVFVAGCKSTQEKKPVEEKKAVKTKKPSDPKVAELIKKLGSDKWKEREEAQSELIKIGKPAIPQLKKALKDADTDLKWRTNLILSEFSPAREKLEWLIRKEMLQMARSSMDWTSQSRFSYWYSKQYFKTSTTKEKEVS